MQCITKLFAAFLLFSGCTSALSPETDYQGEGIAPRDTGKHDYVRSAALWREREIPVCWENLGDGKASDRDLVQKAVKFSWERSSQARFIGWGPCDSDSSGVRILISDEREHAQVLGRELDGMDSGIVLNFQYSQFMREVCGPPVSNEQRKRCLQIGAVHEFGHVLGFAHEQNRPDTPAVSCASQAQGQNGDQSIGRWDAKSVMNYCNPLYVSRTNWPWVLSDGDAKAIATLYGEPDPLE